MRKSLRREARRRPPYAPNRIAPGLIDKYLASAGYKGQLSDETLPADAPANLFEPVPGNYVAHGRFDSQSKMDSWRCSPTVTGWSSGLRLGFAS